MSKYGFFNNLMLQLIVCCKGGKEGWFKMIGPDANKSQQFLLNKQGGEHLPAIENIKIIDRK